MLEEEEQGPIAKGMEGEEPEGAARRIVVPDTLTSAQTSAQRIRVPCACETDKGLANYVGRKHAVH